MNFWDEVSLLIRSLDSQRVEAISIKMMSLPTPSEDHSSLKNSVDKKKKKLRRDITFSSLGIRRLFFDSNNKMRKMLHKNM